MRVYVKVLGGLLLAWFTTSGLAMDDPPGSLVSVTATKHTIARDPFRVLTRLTENGYIMVSNYRDQFRAVILILGSSNREQTREIDGNVTGATLSGNILIVEVSDGSKNAIVRLFDADTGADIGVDNLTVPPAVLTGGSISFVGGAVVAPGTHLAALDSGFGKAATPSPLIALLAVEAQYSPSLQYRSGVYLFDPSTGQLVTSFGNGGHVYAQGDFQGRWIAATPNGVVIGGASRLDPAHPGIGVANFDLQGNPGTCGTTVKEVLPRSDQFVLPDTTGGFYDSGSSLVSFVGEANGARFFGRQLKADCTLNATTFTYPPQNVFVGGVAGVAADTMAVVVNEVGNGTSAARVALYSIANGGAPTAVSPIITSADLATASAVADSGADHAKAVSISYTNATSIAVQADAQILIAGTAEAAGTTTFIASYVGVETTTPVVEFYNTTLNHYFITADPNEATAIDGGSAGPGWSRTGQTWKSGGPARVCRFYGVQSAGGPNGHFYTIDPDECAAVMLDPGWHFESYDFSGWPVTSSGVCPAGTNPIKRAYNGRFAQHDSNHRYATNDTIYNQMIGLGWSGEGVVFCSVQ